MKLGMLGGTFDPIHNGHLRLALEVYEHCKLDKILFVPTPMPEHRASPKASFDHRCRMVEEAIKPLDYFELFQLPNEKRYAFSCNAVSKIKQALSPTYLFFVIGDDSFATLPSWHEWRRLAKECKFIVCTRPTEDPLQLPMDIAKQLGKSSESNELISKPNAHRWAYLSIPKLDISATYIRKAAKEHKQLYGLSPAVVAHYIEANRLYREL